MEEFQGRSGGVPGLTRTPAYLAWSIDGKQDSLAAGKVSNDATLEGNYEYVAAADLYFGAAFLPDVPARTSVVTLHHTIDLPSDPSNPASEKSLHLSALPWAIPAVTHAFALRGPEADGYPRGDSHHRPRRQAGRPSPSR
jgi:hypothetical protein